VIRKSWDLALASALALAAMALTLLGASGPLRLFLGLPLVLVLPGYALTAALFPRRAFDASERLLFSLGISIAVTILGGFLLNLSPWGLQADSWSVLLAYLTFGGCLAAFARRRFAPAEMEGVGEQAHAAKNHAPGHMTIRLSIGQALLFGLAAALIVGAVVVSRDAAAQRPAADVIQLWILPGEPGEVRVGVNNLVAVEATFRLQVLRDGHIIREWPALALTAGQKWAETVPVQAEAGRGPLEARLYRLEEPSVVYRRVTLWPDIE
jgi:uncharacterized membrane protein